MNTPEDVDAVVHIDLRSGAAEIDSAQALRAEVARRLGRAGLPEPDHPLFLVVDTPAGLIDHQRQYELLTTYRALYKVRILVLLLGSTPGYHAGEDEAFLPDRRLVRPSVLRADGIALLWAGDLRSARTALEQLPPDDSDALAVLVDMLSVPDTFRRVLDDIASLPDAVAAPGVRLLEQDLPPEVRDRAWRDALARFAGEDREPAADLPETALSGAELPETLRALITGRGGRELRHRTPGGPADQAYHACAQALERAEDDVTALRSLPGLLSRTRRAALEEDLEQAHEALASYRELVTTALQSDGGSGAAPSAAEAASRLAALGLHVPSADGVGDRIGEGLREFAGKLLGRGLALRAVAQRFTALAGQVEPVPGTTLLPRLADHSADRVARRTGVQGAPVAEPAIGPSAAAGVAGLLGALWQGPSAALAVLVPLVFVVAALAGASRLRDTSRPAGLGRPPLGSQIAAGGGALAGVALAFATGPPPWLGTAGLLVAAAVTADTVRRLWRTAAGSWATSRGTAELRDALAGLDGLLTRLVREHWAAEERLYCADAARSVAGMLRATAVAADAEALPEAKRAEVSGTAAPSPPAAEPTADDWLTSASTLEAEAYGNTDDGDTEWASEYAWEELPAADTTVPRQAASTESWEKHPARVPRWLHRETGEGGPELVATLAGDLTDAAMIAMDSYWGAVERGQAGAHAARRTEERVRDLLSHARVHLQRNGVLAAPRLAAAHRVRASSANLLGTDPQRVADLVGAEPDRHAVVQLSSPEQGALLSRDPTATVWLRLAPEAVRSEVEKTWRANGSVQPEDPLWTSTGRYAGLIRLTPLRMGVVETVRPRQGPDPDPSGRSPADPYHEGPSNPYDEGPPDPYARRDPGRW